MHIDPQTLIAVGVAAHLLAALAKTVFRTPKRQAQIDAIERKVDEVLGEVKGTLPTGR
jgi:hypothetical protein